MSIAFVPERLFNGEEILPGHAVLVKDGIVHEVVPSSAIPAGYRRREIPGALLAPAFMDLQIYGGNGKMFSTELTIESLDATYEYCLGGGCTQFMITMATTSIEKFLSGIEVVRDYWAQGGKGLLGLHMEGPYINPVKKGAHLEKFIKTPTVEEVKMILDKGRGAVKYITLAPELCDPEIIQMILHLGIIVSAGHSNATYQEATSAFDAGIPVATHLFNAMSPLQHRAPGLVGAIYDHPKAKSSVVCDGIHVDFPAVRISKKIMGDRLFYITDAVAEVKHGEYQHIFKGDKFTLPDGTLSGSALTMLQCVKNGVEQLNISLEESLRMASLYPARMIRMDKYYGSIHPGSKADFVALDKDLVLQQVIVDGD